MSKRMKQYLLWVAVPTLVISFMCLLLYASCF